MNTSFDAILNQITDAMQEDAINLSHLEWLALEAVDVAPIEPSRIRGALREFARLVAYGDLNTAVGQLDEVRLLMGEAETLLKADLYKLLNPETKLIHDKISDEFKRLVRKDNNRIDHNEFVTASVRAIATANGYGDAACSSLEKTQAVRESVSARITFFMRFGLAVTPDDFSGATGDKVASVFLEYFAAKRLVDPLGILTKPGGNTD